MSKARAGIGDQEPTRTAPRLDALQARVEATLTLNAAGDVAGLDEAAAALLDAPVAAALGRPFTALVAEPQRAGLRALLAELGPGAPAWRVELELAPVPDRRPRAGDAAPPVRVEATLAPAPRDGQVTVHLHDIVTRRIAERVTLATETVTGAIARAETPTRAAELLLASLGTAMGWDLGGYWTVAHDGDLERVAAWCATGEDAAAVLPERLARAGSLAGRALDANTTVWTSETGDESGRLPAGDGPRSGDRGAVAVPMERDGEPRAAIVFYAAALRDLDPATLRALTETGRRIGDLFGVLEERYDLVTRLARLALTDELTGLPNRRAWEETLTRELARAARGGYPVCVAVLDLDNFKAFNDEHGHQAGDRLLAAAAGAWQRQLRVSDLLARYGGEEFAAVIPAWPLQTAVEVVERLRSATPGGLTASAGVANWDGAETGAELFGRADAALYEAKQAGRDRTVAHADADADR